MIEENFWKDKRVFITGSTGLVGVWLTKYLINMKSKVVCLIRDSVPESIFWKENYDKFVTIVYGKIEDYSNIERALNEYEIDTVFHLGAQTIVGTANRSPIGTFEANIKGTWNLLEASRISPLIKRIVIASSDKAYGANDKLPYTEDIPLKGLHPYDCSKSCSDLLSQMYYKTYNLPVGIARCGNIFGGGDLNFNRIIPGTIVSILKNERPIIRSNGKYTRDYIYVEDIARAYIMLAEKLNDSQICGEAFNFSNEHRLTVLELVKMIAELMDRSDLNPEILNNAQNEIIDQSLSAQKARDVLSWESEFSIEKGLLRTVAWYKTFLMQEDR